MKKVKKLFIYNMLKLYFFWIDIAKIKDQVEIKKENGYIYIYQDGSIFSRFKNRAVVRIID